MNQTKLNNSSKLPVYDLILIIDDHLVDVFITSKIIESTHFAKKVLEYNSPFMALDYLRKNEREPEWIPDLILLDINMPLVDGFRFMDEFAKLGENVKKKTRIVFLSSSLNPNEIERAEKNPFVLKFITKPLTAEKLKQLVSR